MKILGLIASPLDPASRFRIMQYKKPFSLQNIFMSVKYFIPLRDKNPAPWMHRLKNITGINEWRTADFLKSFTRLPLLLKQNNFDIIWQNRLLLPYHIFFENNYKKPFVFDFDDAIWINEGEKEVVAAISKARMVFTGNEYLAEFAEKYNKNTLIIPTVIDTEILYPTYTLSEKFTIGWIGSKSNFPYLDIIKQTLYDFLSAHKDARLVIISTEKPTSFKFDNNQVIFYPWQPDKENEMINEFSVGIMPLPDNNYTKGKCSYKMLQYMACGKPVIVSPVGMNNKLLSESNIGFAAKTQEDWHKALMAIKTDTHLSQELGKNGTNLVNCNYSVKKYAPIIASYLTKISGK